MVFGGDGIDDVVKSKSWLVVFGGDGLFSLKFQISIY